MLAIKINNFKKLYGDKIGVEDVSLEVEEGEIFGFVGPNGAGKSTTIRTILGLIFATSGTVEVLGRTGRTAIDAARADIGYMPSEANFYGALTAREVLQYSANLHGKGAQNIEPLAERVHLDLDKRVDDLSLGNRKKVGIISCVLHEPRLIILDEPTSGLDPVMQRIFFDILLERNKAGNTVFLSSHNLAEVQAFCRRVAIIKDGKIVVCGNIEQVCGKNLKEVRLAGVAESAVTALLNISGLKIEGDLLTFDYSGESDALLDAIYKLRPRDFSVTNADLERVILHHYF